MGGKILLEVEVVSFIWRFKEITPIYLHAYASKQIEIVQASVLKCRAISDIALDVNVPHKEFFKAMASFLLQMAWKIIYK